jgi:hypothetical protein
MQPSSVITRIDLSITQAEFNLAADRLGFIGPRVLRPILVGMQSADFGKIRLTDLLQTRETLRSARAGYNEIFAEFDKNSYATEDHGLMMGLDDRELRKYRDLIDAEMFTIDLIVDGVLRKYEIDVAAAVFNTTTWAGAALTTAGTDWSHNANGTPITDVFAAREKIYEGSGLEPNALIINRKLRRDLLQNAQIIDSIRSAGAGDSQLPGRITDQQLAEAFDLDQVIVAGSAKNKANPGQAADVERIWGSDKAMLAKVATSDNPLEPSIGHTFLWNEDGPGALGSEEELAVLVEEWRDENVRGSKYRARNDRGEKVMYKEAGHLLTGLQG